MGLEAVTCHGDERDNTTRAQGGGRREVTDVNEEKHAHTGATASELMHTRCIAYRLGVFWLEHLQRQPCSGLFLFATTHTVTRQRGQLRNTPRVGTASR
jgi:hypothetical protein